LRTDLKPLLVIAAKGIVHECGRIPFTDNDFVEQTTIGQPHEREESSILVTLLLVVFKGDPVTTANACFHKVGGASAEGLNLGTVLPAALGIAVQLLGLMELGRVDADEADFLFMPNPPLDGTCAALPLVRQEYVSDHLQPVDPPRGSV
jgi:hypothetical protein